LTIQLDEPHRPRIGGETISGTVSVKATGPVRCSGLEVTSYWTTHGRGNVERGDADSAVIFEGEWDALREYSYPFTLTTAAWPPTYYGTYLNVSHFVRARAKLPWSSDPKSEAEFVVAATSAPDDLKPTVVAKRSVTGLLLGWTIGLVLIVLLLAVFSVLLLFLLPIIGIGAGLVWFFQVFLPARYIGSAECVLEPNRLSAGQTLQGRLRFTPKRDVTIEHIQWIVTCVEKCVSGSGSRKTTHVYEVLRKGEQLAEAAALRVGMPQAFQFSCPLPEHGPPSMKFSENEVTWSGEVRIAIPKWPDWVKRFPLVVGPSPEARTAAAAAAGPEADSTPALLPTDDAWFDEVVRQVINSRGDKHRMETVLRAVQDQVFSVRLELLEPQDTPPLSGRHERGTWMFAQYHPQDEELCLLWPAPSQPPAKHMANWQGHATILGFDDDLDCLLMRVTAGR